MTKMSTWTSAGVNAVTSTLVQGYCSSGISKAAVSGLGSGISGGLTTGNWKESMVNGMRNSAAGYLSGQLGGVLGQTTGLGGSAVDNFLNYSMRKMLGSKEEFSWDMIAQNNAVGDMMSKYMSDFFMSPEQLAASREKEKADAEKRKRDFDSLDFMERLDRAVEGMYLSMKSDMLGTVKDMKHLSDDVVKGLDYAAKTAGDLAESAGKWISDGLFGNDPEPVVMYGRVAGIYTDKKGNIRDSADNRFLSGKLEYGSKDYEYVMKQLGYTDEDFQIKEEKGGITKVIQFSNDGFTKQTTAYNGETVAAELFENYYNYNGKILKASDTMFIYNAESMEKINRKYDASGEGVYETDVYTFNNQKGDFDLEYKDIWLRDTSGNVMTDYKQGDYNFVMNNNIGTDAIDGDDGVLRHRNTNTSAAVGCLVSQVANSLGFMGLQNDPDSPLYGMNLTPETVDNLNDKFNAYQNGSARMSQNVLAEALDLNYAYEKDLSLEGYRQIIDKRLDQGLSTIAYVPNHFVSIAGARYDSSDNRTGYLIRNSSRNGFTIMNRDTLYGRGKGRIQSIGWFYK